MSTIPNVRDNDGSSIHNPNLLRVCVCIWLHLLQMWGKDYLTSLSLASKEHGCSFVAVLLLHNEWCCYVTIHVETVCPTVILHVSCGDTKPVQAVLSGTLFLLH